MSLYKDQLRVVKVFQYKSINVSLFQNRDIFHIFPWLLKHSTVVTPRTKFTQQKKVNFFSQSYVKIPRP
jgi:hypothetical protein